MYKITRIAAAAAFVIAAPAMAASTYFSQFTPLASSAGPIPIGGAGEATPMTLSSPNFFQRSIADRAAQLNAGQANSGSWDMITLNETGANRGRYLFTVFETGSSGIQRHDLATGIATTIWQSPAVAPSPQAHVAFDASYWTPWGTFVTAEESWGTQPQPYGRMFELRNPLAATNNANADFRHANAVSRVSHEGVQWDRKGNMYYIDELNGGSIYRYSSAASFADVKAGTADYFAGGTNSVLRVGNGNTANAVGSFSWVAFTDATGTGLAGAVTVTDPNGVTSVDGRATTNLVDFKGTDYQRPEDLQIKTLANGQEVMFVATTTTNEV
ncbi:MAG: alkaline phosphatase PhoX, partial [Aquabacterium sp.]